MKIVATVGPASESEEQLSALIDAGVDVFRLNFSHGTPEGHAHVIERVRRLTEHSTRPVSILADLQGPKIRIGALREEEVQLLPNAPFTITARTVPGDAHEVTCSFAGLPAYVTAGQRLLMDDGRLELQVTAVDGSDIRCRVVRGGPLRAHKGINLPDVQVNIPSFTDKDRDDLAYCLDLGVDYVALSFVQQAEDIIPVRALMKARRARVPIIAKIEKPAALQHLEEILRAFDGVLVARGDLGVETSPEAVPVSQKRIIQRANAAGKPVITATQMLESMTHSLRPTRAEASDVANAVWDGTDALMLSGETAIGDYPVETVRTLARIAYEAELHDVLARPRSDRTVPGSHAAAMVQAAGMLAHGHRVAALVVLTRSGRTAQLASAQRPPAPILALTEDAAVCRRLVLWWGVHPFVLPFVDNTDAMVSVAEAFLLERGVLQPGDTVVLVGSMPLVKRGRSNFVKLYRVAEEKKIRR